MIHWFFFFSKFFKIDTENFIDFCICEFNNRLAKFQQTKKKKFFIVKKKKEM